MEPLEEAEGGPIDKKALETERLRRAKFLKQARKRMPYVSVTANDDVFFIPTDDYRIGANLFTRSRSKDMIVLPRAMRLLAKLDHWLPEDPVFVDVGANIGTATITALQHHGFASAVALEPSPGNFKALRLGLIANELEDRVQALGVAASDREGERIFVLSKTSSGTHRFLSEGDERPEQSVAVQVVTLDGLVSQGLIDAKRVGLVWVDTSGHEAQALAGGVGLLEAGIPIVTAIKRSWTECEALHELLSPYYSHVVDLRKPQVVQPIREFRKLIDGFARSTDVLLAP